MGSEAFAAFLLRPDVAALGWPAEVARQWLWDFGDRVAFVADYGAIDLSRVCWECEDVAAADFDTMQTGDRDGGWIEEVAGNHGHWLRLRARAEPAAGTAWDEHGTWLVPPVLIDRSLLDPAGTGLQVVEGRTRVGILRGRRRDGLHTAPVQRAWVGRPRR